MECGGVEEQDLDMKGNTLGSGDETRWEMEKMK